MAESETMIHQLRREVEERPSMTEINEMLNTKANKPTVAQALHRKANKGEVEEMLSQKVDIEEFNRLITKLNEKASTQELGQIIAQIDSKVDRNEIHDLNLGRAGRSTDSVESTWFNALAKDRDIYNSRLENFESEMRS